MTEHDEDTVQNATNMELKRSVAWNPPHLRKLRFCISVGPTLNIYTLGEEPLQAADCIRDLGFMVTKDLSSDTHCDVIAAKAMHLVHNSFRALSTRNPTTLLKVYKLYNLPILEYDDVVFCPYKKKFIAKLEKVQNSFTRKLMIRSVGFMYADIPSSNARNLSFGLT